MKYIHRTRVENFNRGTAELSTYTPIRWQWVTAFPNLRVSVTTGWLPAASCTNLPLEFPTHIQRAVELLWLRSEAACTGDCYAGFR